ncbi:MAG: hypothetical protein Pg6B_00360 [Candidatus Azobacteroides pseudotrichonymphae]|nr:hypothetical protein [Bacteroidales bacterium OttesenSCG-928-I14]GMO32101.1 MAG: hypothetical protein Pg6B_00360 [Candidatus Azobacteroides pseudotrichonymphae]
MRSFQKNDFIHPIELTAKVFALLCFILCIYTNKRVYLFNKSLNLGVQSSLKKII